MAYQIRGNETEDGVLVNVSDGPTRFSFIVGKGKIGFVETQGNCIWTVGADSDQYSLVMLLFPIADDVLGKHKPLDILVSHMRWEMDHQRQSGAAILDDESIGGGEFPTGEVYLTWTSRLLVHEGAKAQATTLHGGKIIFFSLSAFGESWNSDRLSKKLQAIMLSVFRE